MAPMFREGHTQPQDGAPVDRPAAAAAGPGGHVRHLDGLLLGLVGVAAFSLTLPMTRVAVGGLSPILIGAARAVVAAALAVLALAITRQRLPHGGQWTRLVVIGAGIVVGFPVLTSLAMQTAPASHGAVVVALLPAATAAMAVLRGHERPPAAFWVATALGSVAAVGFASAQGGGLGELHAADALLFAAVLAAAVGYAEGGLLARELGAWQTVSWALVVCAPLMVALTVVAAIAEPPDAAPDEWAAFAYLAVVSMYLGFFAWYRGLAIGPIARVSQVQLVQPILTIGWAVVLLGEEVTAATLVGGLVVIACAAAAVRARVSPNPPHGVLGGHPPGREPAPQPPPGREEAPDDHPRRPAGHGAQLRTQHHRDASRRGP